MILLKRYYNLIIIIAIACLIVFPRRSGYLLLLDFAAWPEYSLSHIQRYDGIVWIMIQTLNVWLGGMITQYIIMMGCMVGLWYGAYRLLSQIERETPPIWIWFGTIFMMINPFIYQRLVEWQINVVWGYAIIMLGLPYLYNFYKKNNLTNLIIWSLIGGLGLSLLYHSLFFIILLNTLTLLWTSSRIKKIWYYLLSMSIIFIINLNRIIAGIFQISSMGQTVNQIDNVHIAGFETLAWPFWIAYHTLSLHGFWWEAQWRFISNYATNDQRPILFGLVSIGILYGGYLLRQSRKTRNFCYWLCGIGIISYILGMWIAAPWPLHHISQLLYDYLPFYSGLREPQKRIGIVLIVYVIFWSVWWWTISRQIVSQDLFWKRSIGPIIVLLPVIYTPTMLFALKWQLAVVNYPAGYYDFKDRLYTDTQYDQHIQKTKHQTNTKAQFDILALPRHQYMNYSFTQKIAPNIRDKFFEVYDDRSTRRLVGDNMEMENIYTQSTRPESKIVEKYIWPDGIWKQDYTISSGLQFCQDMTSLWLYGLTLFKELAREDHKKILDRLEQDTIVRLQYQNDALLFYTLTCPW
jgi:hypothetical protein